MSSEKDSYNFAVISKHDSCLSQVIYTSSICEVYRFNHVKNDWDRTDCKGTFFLYSRVSTDGYPYAILVLNRNNNSDFSIGITPIQLSAIQGRPPMEVDIQDPIIMVHSDPGVTYGLWLFSEPDRAVVLRLLNWCLTMGSTQ